MDNQELTKILLLQIKERDEMIKNMADNINKISDAYIIKDKEKDKRHMKILLTTTISCLIAMTIIVAIFICSYFWSNYPISTINGDGNSTISGSNNTNNQNKGGAE